MKLVPRASHLAAYLQVSPIIDFGHPTVLDLAAQLREQHETVATLAQACFEWVRDNIAHSGDAQRGPLTLCASEVLASGVGFCYSKSHLLAALLRANGIPAGFCYQRLTVSESGGPYCLHGLNAVLLPQHGWYRIDARGNRPDIQAAFSPPLERLAFVPQDEEERDFPDILAAPHPIVVEALRSRADIVALQANLPDARSLDS